MTIGADDSVRETLATMERAQVRRLPVIDGHRLVGIISAADIARHLSRAQERQAAAGDLQAPPPRARVAGSRIALVVVPLAGAGIVLVQATLGDARGDPPEHRRQGAGALGV